MLARSAAPSLLLFGRSPRVSCNLNLVIAGLTVFVIGISAKYFWCLNLIISFVVISLVNAALAFLQTTLLSRLLKNANGLRIAVLVNDLAEVIVFNIILSAYFPSAPGRVMEMYVERGI